MKNKIISVVLSITIVLSTILQSVVVRANPVVYLGGGLFTLLMTALAHCGYTVESPDSANYIYNFFFKKWLSDEDLKNMGLEGQSNAKEFWEGIEEKLTTPLDEKYPSLKGVFDYKITSSGAKLVANATPTLKQAIDQLVNDLPDTVVQQMAPCDTIIPSSSFSFPLTWNSSFPKITRLESDEGDIITSPIAYMHVINPTDSYVSIDYYIKPSTYINQGSINFDEMHFFNITPYYDGNIALVGISDFKGNFAMSFDCEGSYTKHFFYDNTFNLNSRNFEVTLDSTDPNFKSLQFGDLYTSEGVYDIPFNEGSKSLYNDNEAIWEQMGSIEAKLDDVISQPLTDSYSQSVGMTFPLTQEVADTYVQEKDEIDIKSKDEVKEEESNIPVTPEVEMDGIYENSSKLTDKFPFCIPWDVAKCVEGFKRSADPKVSFKIPFPYVGDFDINIDLSDYETPLTILRFFELLGFILGILILTRNHFTRG